MNSFNENPFLKNNLISLIQPIAKLELYFQEEAVYSVISSESKALHISHGVTIQSL
jgi:hypothetical protein